MSHLILRRLITSAVTLFLLVTFVFFLVRIAPGDPSRKYISPGLDKRMQESIKESFQLNSPLHVQYLNFLKNVVRGDLGISYEYRQPVIKVIGEYLPFTFIFSSMSFLIQIILSLYLAVIAVKNLNGFLDKFLSGFMITSFATPVFVSGVILVYLFSIILNILPSSGLTSIDYDSMNFFGKIADVVTHLLLPFITLSLIEVSIFYKYLRDNVNEIYNKTFIMNLRSSGMQENKILFKHVIPNAINPLISAAGIELGILLGGTLIIEVIFGLPGMGRLTVNAIQARDYPLVIGCTITAGFFMIAANLLADIVRVKMDKRFLAGVLN
ncbi:MAG: ABC transporter permease [Ignavibacteriales bacterium]|nr:MAG: ABC transporter permease [Ignavibacteriales bacterium]